MKVMRTQKSALSQSQSIQKHEKIGSSDAQ